MILKKNESSSFDNSNPNIEWKKKKSSPRKRSARKIEPQNVEENSDFVVASAIRELPAKSSKVKISKKIADVYDDEEDDEYDSHFRVLATRHFENEMILNLIDEEEKDKKRRQEFINKGIALQKNAGKLGVVDTANLLAKETGFKQLNTATVADTMNSSSDNPQELLQKSVNKALVPQAKLKPQRLNLLQPNQLKDFFVGVKRIETLGGSKSALCGLALSDVVQAGKKHTQDKHIARLLLKKSGRTRLKKPQTIRQSSVSPQKKFNDLVLKKTALEELSQ